MVLVDPKSRYEMIRILFGSHQNSRHQLRLWLSFRVLDPHLGLGSSSKLGWCWQTFLFVAIGWTSLFSVSCQLRTTLYS